MLKTIQLAVIASALTFGLNAAPAIAQSGDTIEVFTTADLTQALDSIDATHTPSDDGRTINLTFENGINANAAIMACEDEENLKTCYATSILATFGRPDGATDEQVAKAINDYNYLENFGRAYLDPDGRISARMYIISDGGIKRENYRQQIGLWAYSLADFIGYLYPEE